MTISNQKILLAITGATLFLFPLVVFTSGVPRIVFGLLLVLFFLGYTLLSALFLRKADFSGPERVALSFGLRIAIMPFLGLGISPQPCPEHPLHLYIDVKQG